MSERDPAQERPRMERVFLMIRYRQTHAHELITDAIESTLADLGVVLSRADRSVKKEDLWGNVKRHMDESTHGIAVLDAIDGKVPSPSVCLELGYMLGQSRSCLVLKDRALDELPTDLQGFLREEFDATTADSITATIPAVISAWARKEGVRKRHGERLLIFVSSGGTCRDPMAKAITEALLNDRSLDFDVRVEAYALYPPMQNQVTAMAREAIRKMLGHDVLFAHVPKQLPRAAIEDADLILSIGALSPSASRTLSGGKHRARGLCEFFGYPGDVEDPFPVGTQSAYDQCAATLRSILEPNVERLVTFLRDPENEGDDSAEVRPRRWHPDSADFVSALGARDDYDELYRFPCCGTTVRVSNGAPNQVRDDGCAEC